MGDQYFNKEIYLKSLKKKKAKAKKINFLDLCMKLEKYDEKIHVDDKNNKLSDPDDITDVMLDIDRKSF